MGRDLDYDSAYYKKIVAEETEQAKRLARYLIDTYCPCSVIDFGCADGLYLRPFEAEGIAVAGVDLSPVSKYSVGDLRIPYQDWGRHDLALCLEVLEHIEEDSVLPAIENIAVSTRRIVLSAAIPGQGGVNHTNLQYKPYWIKKFARYGFDIDRQETRALLSYMRQGYHLGWFTQNAMILRRLS
jgi:2-polyprenyl-3-methyl-5-hydroxy-6-metoxy-1,4-benzoquinol methylase